MLEDGIYNEIKNDPTLAGKLLSAGIYNIYPLRVPDNTQVTKAVTYTEVTQNLVYPLARTSLIQLNCIAPTFEEARDLANDIDRIFNDKAEYFLGGTFPVKYTAFKGRNSFYDTNAQMFIFAVEVSIKY